MTIDVHKKLDLEQGEYTDLVRVTQTDTGADLVNREVVVLGDAEDGGLVANVASQTATSGAGLVTKELRSEDIVNGLNAIRDELVMIRMHLNQITELES